jgi:hypothetical protein
MKKRISKILGIGLTLSLLISLILTASPVSALTQPSVSLSNDDISATGVGYSMLFTLAKDLPEGGKIVVEFPTGTDLTGVVAADINLSATSGIGSDSFGGVVATTIVKSPSATTGPTVTITVPDVNTQDKIGLGAMVQVHIDDVKNPGSPGDYTLDVSTLTSGDATIEAAVTSTTYTLEAPTIPALPGIVSVYNDIGILMAQYTGATGIQDALDAAGEDWVVKIGPGTYTENPYTTYDGLTIEGIGAVEDIIINGDWYSDYEDITFDGLSINGEMYIDTGSDDLLIQNCVFGKLSSTADEFLIWWDSDTTDDATIKDCVIDTTKGTADDDIGIVATAHGLTVDGCSFMLNHDDIGVGTDADTVVKNSDFTGSSGVGVAIGYDDVDVMNNTFDGVDNAVNVDGAADVIIKGNTIMNCTGDVYNGGWGAQTNGGAIHIEYASNVVIVSNDIMDTDADEYAIVCEAMDDYEEIFVIYNNITGNAKNIDNNYAGELDASNNWWGSADGPAAGSTAGAVDTSPWLGSAVSMATADYDTDADLNDKSGTGIVVRSPYVAADGDDDYDHELIAVAALTGNPGAATPYPPLPSTFLDVYVSDADVENVEITIRFYDDVAENDQVMAWSALAGEWVQCSDSGINEFSGYGWCRIRHDTTPDLEELQGLGFVIVRVPPPPPTLPAPVLEAPMTGDDTVSKTPSFSWSAVSGADGYFFELADNANFVAPLAKQSGDLGRLNVTAYAYVQELDYSTAYYWRVKAVSGTEAADNLVESAWVAGLFTVMAEPEEPTPPIVVEEQPPVVIEPIIELPDVIEEPITPGWIYAIIAIGAVLVIAVIVLIVRTRRSV